MSYEPIPSEELQQLRDAMRAGLSMQQCRRLISELERAERERQRLQDEIENVRVGRSAMRDALLLELQELRKEVAEQKAWIQVAAESNGAVDAYLKQIEPSLEEPYGMPVDGVRRVVEMLQEQIRILREKRG
jgi:predicted  nucleic acid-binding Zn-ribbon protein